MKVLIGWLVLLGLGLLQHAIAAAKPCVRLDVYDELPTIVSRDYAGRSVKQPPHTEPATERLLAAIGASRLRPPKDERVEWHVQLHTPFSPHADVTYPANMRVLLRVYPMTRREWAEKFSREAQTFLAVQRAGCHPHIIHCLGFAVHADWGYIVLEDAEDTVGKSQLRHNTHALLTQMSSALVFLHEAAGRVHARLTADDIFYNSASNPEHGQLEHYWLGSFTHSVFIRGQLTRDDLYTKEEEIVQFQSPACGISRLADSTDLDMRPSKEKPTLPRQINKLLDIFENGRAYRQEEGAWRPIIYSFLNRNTQLRDARLPKVDVYSLAVIALHTLARVPAKVNIFEQLLCAAEQRVREKPVLDPIFKQLRYFDQDNEFRPQFIGESKTMHATTRTVAVQLLLGTYDMADGHIHPNVDVVRVAPEFWKDGLGLDNICPEPRRPVMNILTRHDPAIHALVKTMLRVIPDDAPSMRTVCDRLRCRDYTHVAPEKRLPSTEVHPLDEHVTALPTGAVTFTNGELHPAELRRRIRAAIAEAPQTTKLQEALRQVTGYFGAVHVRSLVDTLEIDESDVTTVLYFVISIGNATVELHGHRLFTLELLLSSPRDGRGPVRSATLHVDRVDGGAGAGSRAKFFMKGLVSSWAGETNAALASSAAQTALKEYDTWLRSVVQQQVQELYSNAPVALSIAAKPVKLPASASSRTQ